MHKLVRWPIIHTWQRELPRPQVAASIPLATGGKELNMARIKSLAVVCANTRKIVSIECALTRNQLIAKCRRHNDRNLRKVAIAKVEYDLEVGPAFGQRKVTNLTIVNILDYSL